MPLIWTGRLDSVELELEDIVGPDGDVVDLNERMDRLEGKAPELIKTLKAREKRGAEPLELGPLKQRVDALQTKLEAFGETLGKAAAKKPAPSASSPDGAAQAP